MGVLLRKEDEGVIGGVTGGVRLPLVWRGGVAVLFLDTPPVMDRDNLGVAFFFMVSCSRRAASVMNLMTREIPISPCLSSFTAPPPNNDQRDNSVIRSFNLHGWMDKR